MAAIPLSLRHWIADRGLDSRPQVVRRRGLALAVRAGGNAGYPARHRCVFLFDGLGRAKRPGSAAEQRQWIKQTAGGRKAVQPGSDHGGAGAALSHVLLLTAAVFLDYFAGYAVVFWLPTVLKRQSGFSDVRIGLLGALPYAVALVAMLINGWHSDRSRERRWHAAVPIFITAAALLGLSPQGSTLLTVVSFSMVVVNMAALPALWAIPTEILSESATAAAVGMINAVGSVAGFAGPYVFGYLHSRTGSLSYGFTLLTVSAFAAGMLFLLTPGARQRVSPKPLPS